MKVSHLGDEHLLCLSSEEVALLVDLCYAAVFSDELGSDVGRSADLQRFMGQMQDSLFSTAQSVWRKRHGTDALTPPAPATDESGRCAAPVALAGQPCEDDPDATAAAVTPSTPATLNPSHPESHSP